jgi:hypothetical protein
LQNGLIYYWNMATFEMEKEIDSEAALKNMVILMDEKNFVFG